MAYIPNLGLEKYIAVFGSRVLILNFSSEPKTEVHPIKLRFLE